MDAASIQTPPVNHSCGPRRISMLFDETTCTASSFRPDLGIRCDLHAGADLRAAESLPRAAAAQKELHPANLLAIRPRPAAAPGREGQLILLDLEAAVARHRGEFPRPNANPDRHAGGYGARTVRRGHLQVAVAVGVGHTIRGHVGYCRGINLTG